jgi:thiamine pyrophosphate-dependent acetolactate synthase large subunit-like protein
MAASGPGVTNLVTGIAHAWADCTPVIALGGAAPVVTWHRGAFQDIDQLAMFKPCTTVIIYHLTPASRRHWETT